MFKREYILYYLWQCLTGGRDFMKKIGIIITIVACISLGSVLLIKSRSVETYNTSYYSIVVPDKWEIQEHKDMEYTTFLWNNEKAASIEVFKNCEYASSVSSISNNIFGMHSYIESEEIIRKEKDFQLRKVVVGYEQSAAEIETKRKPQKKEEHYIWTNYKDTVIDFFIDKTKVKESEKEEIIKNFHV